MHFLEKNLAPSPNLLIVALLSIGIFSPMMPDLPSISTSPFGANNFRGGVGVSTYHITYTHMYVKRQWIMDRAAQFLLGPTNDWWQSVFMIIRFFAGQTNAGIFLLWVHKHTHDLFFV